MSAETSTLPTDRPWTVEHAMYYLGKSKAAIYSLVATRRLKKLPGSRKLYFTKESLDDFLEGRN